MHLLTALTALTAQTVEGRLIAAAVLPHGDFAYDPKLVNDTGGSLQLHQAAQRLGREAQTASPELIFLTTPHGLELSERYLFYLNSENQGATPLDDMPHQAAGRKVPLNFTTPSDLGRKLLLKLQEPQESSLPVEGLQGFSNSQPLPISWGEILPLTYLRAYGPLPPVLPMSFPLRRFNHSAEMFDELLLLGARIGEFLDALPERVLWLVSADLAHTHLQSGPYGYCPCAEPYDQACSQWAAAGGSQSSMRALSEARRLQGSWDGGRRIRRRKRNKTH
ncbi:unnamed protein product [Durusdinium trenchii]|uniref:Extradiol ring-cleavage dioxygenase class III enzyme subunit B domain-containing protein n=2 Tax=Durusdinium trenchii TaxID=1381693 RepID=A0ABP0I9G6_9DINO